jgi:hypothetical protein
MGQEIPASKEGSEKSAGERDSQMRQSGEGSQRYVETGAPAGAHGTETAAPVAQEMTSRLTKARVMDVVMPSFLAQASCPLRSSARTSKRRNAASHALGECQTGQSRSSFPTSQPRRCAADFESRL